MHQIKFFSRNYLSKDSRLIHHQESLTIFSPPKIMLNDNVAFKPLGLLTSTQTTSLSNVCADKNDEAIIKPDASIPPIAIISQKIQATNRTSHGKFFSLVFVFILES